MTATALESGPEIANGKPLATAKTIAVTPAPMRLNPAPIAR